MRKALVLMLIASVILSLSACGGIDDSDAGQEAKSELSIRGSFVLEPSEGLNMSGEGLSDMERYFFVVYDLENSSTENKELSGFNNSISITFNNTNTYESKYPNDGELLKSFIDNCGYKTSIRYGTLFGGTDPVRMIVAFAVNKNDISADCTAEIHFNLADNLSATSTIRGTDIMTINEFDGIFVVEDDPDTYQLSRSMKVRSEVVLSLINSMVSNYQEKDFDVATLALVSASTVVDPETKYGISCAFVNGQFNASQDLPVFNLESICTSLPEISDSIRALVSSVNTIYDNWTLGGVNLSSEQLQAALDELDVDLINVEINAVREAASNIDDYFESEQ